MTATQAPTPGPLSGDDVKLLVKGDLLRIDTGGALYRFLRTKASPSSLVIAEPIGGGLEGYYDRCRFAFIGRPDADDWMPWPGGENPVPGQAVEVRFRSGAVKSSISDHFDWSHETRRRKHLSRSVDIIAFRLISKRAAALSELAALDGETMGLAPHAPVEASEADRDWSDAEVEAAAQALVNHRWNGTQPGFDRKPPSWKAEHVAEVKAILAALRPQPSGETREVETEVQYEVWGAGPQGDFCAASDMLSDAQRYAAVYGQDGPVVIKVVTTTRVEWTKDLLSARPLALGGQQGSGEESQ